MSGNRLDKISEQLRVVVGEAIQEEVELDEGTLVTVTRVTCSPTLEHATVFISIFPTHAAYAVLQDLDYSIYAIQQHINKRLKIKTVPKIQFIVDRSEEHASRIDEILESEKSEVK